MLIKLYGRIIKRAIDLVISVFLLFILSPVFLIVIGLLYFFNDAEIFFLQMRPGKDGEPFNIIKFKSMNDRKNSSGNLLPDAQRLTLVGKFIRKTSLDEIPQLINVAKGDMSLIGPRPLLVEYLPLYDSVQKRRHNVRPGITGWAQVNGRNAITWEQKFKYDVWYVENLSFMLDMKILFMTIGKVFKVDGISANGHATTEKFKGSAR